MLAYTDEILAADGTDAANYQGVQQLEKIEVTGSNLKRVDSETAAPLQIVTRADIEKSGKQSISDVIRNLPIDNNGSVSLAFANGIAAGASGVSLRGLTVNATLVLVNGRRMPSYGYADDLQRNFVDLSSIPLEAVDRIEILKDGASAVYGSDAIAGVVNIILRSNYQGVTGSLNYGQSGYGDGKRKGLTLAAGTGDLAVDNYNFFFSLEASQQDAIWQRDRAGRDWIGSGDLRPYGYSIQTGGLSGYFHNDASAAKRISAVGSLVGNVRNPTSATQAYQSLPGCTSSISTAHDAVTGVTAGDGGCVWDITQYLQIQPKEDKLNFYGRGSVNVMPGMQVYGEVGLFKSDVTTFITPSSVSVTWADTVAGIVKSNVGIRLPAGDLDNPFAGSARLRYNTADVGPRRNDYDTTETRFLGGIKGSLGAWDYDTGVLFAESQTRHRAQGYLSNSVLVQNTALSTPSGTPLLNASYRIGDDAWRNTQAFYDALSPTLTSKAETSVSTFDFKASRELAQLDGGALALALGLEARHEEIDSPSLPGTESGDIVGLGYASVKGSRNVTALFAEVSAPLMKTLEVTAALRTDHYSDFGNSTTPKLGVKWKPIQQFALRGTYSEGFRAPGAAENGKSAASGPSTYYDPVRCPLTALAADCGAGAAVVITTGNPDVKPETSKSYTFGFLLEPVKNLSMAIDFWKITKRAEISAADPNIILQNPLAVPNAVVVRDTNLIGGVAGTGTVLSVGAPYVNAGKTNTSGVDLDVRYNWSLKSYGVLVSSLNWTYIDTYTKTLVSGQKFEYVGTHGPTILSGNAGMPRNRGMLGIAWKINDWMLATNLSYISHFSNKENTNGPCLNQFADGSAAPAGCRISSFTNTNVYAKWKLNKNIEFSASIDNVFDKIAPLDPQTVVSAVNYNPTYHLAGAVGRYFQVSMKYSWR